MRTPTARRRNHPAAHHASGVAHAAGQPGERTMTDMHEPLLDSTFLERLERLTLHWDESFAGLVGGHNLSRFAGGRARSFSIIVCSIMATTCAPSIGGPTCVSRTLSEMFQVEPRVPVRLLLDTARPWRRATLLASDQNSISRASWRRHSAMSAWSGWIPLCCSPFPPGFCDPFICGGGRHRFQPSRGILAAARAKGRPTIWTPFAQFIGEYPQRGLVIVISDFLDDQDCLTPLQYLADFGHELFLVQLWGDEDRTPPGEGEMELMDAESGARPEVGSGRGSAPRVH